MEIRIDFRYGVLASPHGIVWKVLRLTDAEYFHSEYMQGPQFDVEDLPLNDDPRRYCPAEERSRVRYVAIRMADNLDHHRLLQFTYWGVDSHMVEVVNAGSDSCFQSLIVSSKIAEEPASYHILRFERATNRQPWIPVLDDVMDEWADGRETCRQFAIELLTEPESADEAQ